MFFFVLTKMFKKPKKSRGFSPWIVSDRPSNSQAFQTVLQASSELMRQPHWEKARMPLTDIKLRTLKSRDKSYKIADQRGLYIVVTP
jgi:hypothetical protein